jgi:hypothetical protein
MKKYLLTILVSVFFIVSVKSQIHPITINSNQRVVSLQMTASEYSSWVTNDEFSTDAKRQAIVQDIYQKFDDKFDFIFLILNETTMPSYYSYVGKCYTTSNSTTGIGISTFNSDVSYCSAGRLKAVIALAQKDYLMNGPSLHELMHNWGNRIISTVDWNGTSQYDAIPHWGFTGGSNAGQLGGFKQSTLQTNVGGNPNKYRASLFGGFANGGNSVPYSDLELYLMGLIPLTDVADFDVFSGITQKTTIGTDITEFTASTRVNYNAAKILTDAGQRNPSYVTSQKDFRLLIVLITPAPLTETEWTNIDAQSEWFGRPSSGGLGYIYNFWEATRGLGTIETGNLLNAVRTAQIIPPTITANGPTTFCNGGSVSLSTTSTDPLQWFKDGNPLDGATSQTYVATQSGSYSLKAGIGNCALESVSPIVVSVTSDIPVPSITASGPTTFCLGGTVTLTSSSSGSYSYLWSNGLTSQSITVNSTGSYSVKLTGNNGCISYPSTSVPVLAGNLGTWTQKTPFGGTARYGVFGFSIGTKIYIGTGYNGSFSKDFWEYDTKTDIWTKKADFGGTARYTAVGFSIGLKGYVGLGYDGTYKKDLWEYDPISNTWTQKADFGGVARNAAVGFSIGSKGYVGTGHSGVTFLKDFWEYDPGSNTWTQKTAFGGAARNYAVGFSIGTKGYIGTGTDGSNKNDFWEYDQGSNSWTKKADFGGVPRYAASGFSIRKKGYLGTGYDGSFKKDFWEYDPFTNTWTQKTDFEGTERYAAVGISIDTAGYLGLGAGTYYEKDFREYNIETPSLIANGPTTFCNGSNVTLTSSLANSYLWSNNATTRSIIVSTAGNYSVTAIDEKGCMTTSSPETIIVSEIPLAAGPIEGPAIVCQGQTSLTYTVPSVANATSYIWTLPGGATGSSTTNSIAVSYDLSALSGSITVKGTNDCGDGSASTRTINVNIKPAKPVISQNGNVLHSDAPSGNQWYNQNGLLNGATGQDYTANVTGDYYVIVTLSDCSSDPSNSVSLIPADLEKTKSNFKVKVYPNPFSNELIIETDGNNDRIEFEILNSAGSAIYKSTLFDKVIVQTGHFAPGIYLIKLDNGKVFEFKKIIKH